MESVLGWLQQWVKVAETELILQTWQGSRTLLEGLQAQLLQAGRNTAIEALLLLHNKTTTTEIHPEALEEKTEAMWLPQKPIKRNAPTNSKPKHATGKKWPTSKKKNKN